MSEYHTWDDRRLAVQNACTQAGVIMIDFWSNATPKIIFTFRIPGGPNIEHIMFCSHRITLKEIEAFARTGIAKELTYHAG